MPHLNITDDQAKAIDALPERKQPLAPSRDKVGRMLLDKGLAAHTKKLAKKKK